MKGQKNLSGYRKLYRIIYEFGKQMTIKNISSFAASTAFFLFISLIPILYLVCSILPYVNITQETLRQSVDAVLPGVIGLFLNSIISDVYGQSAGGVSLAVLVMLWSAGKGMMALMRGLNAINGVEEKRNYFVVRVIASFYTVVMLIVVILSLFLMVFGDQLVTLTLHRIPQLQRIVSFAMNFRFLLVWAVLSVLFAAVYAYVPDKKLAFREQIPGAVFSAVVWSVFSWAFSYYVTYGNSYGIYGSLSIIIIVLLWMYFCMYIIMIGAYLNRYFAPVNKALVNRDRD